MTQTIANGTAGHIRPYLQPAFLLCVAVLATAAFGMSVAIDVLGLYLEHEPIALKESLELLDEKGLGSYTVVGKQKIEDHDIIEALGTTDYIQWVLEDPEVPADSAVRKCMLFITYYGSPDIVPHVPEECYMGGGNQRMSSESIMLSLCDNSSEQSTGQGRINLTNVKEVACRYLVFQSPKAGLWKIESKFPILYLFNVNGQYRNSREDVRFVLNKNIYGKHSYFSKVEWQFFNVKFGRRTYPGRDEVIAASEKLLAVILPVLEKQHWPDWNKSDPDKDSGVHRDI